MQLFEIPPSIPEEMSLFKFAFLNVVVCLNTVFQTFENPPLFCTKQNKYEKRRPIYTLCCRRSQQSVKFVFYLGNQHSGLSMNWGSFLKGTKCSAGIKISVSLLDIWDDILKLNVYRHFDLIYLSLMTHCVLTACWYTQRTQSHLS